MTIPNEAEKIISENFKASDLHISSAQQAVNTMKAIWKWAYGDDAPMDHVTDKHHLFRSNWWNCLLKSSRTAKIEERLIHKHVIKLHKEATCLRNKGGCPNQCPSPDWMPCPNCEN
jgi:hypothetical protein